MKTRLEVANSNRYFTEKLSTREPDDDFTFRVSWDSVGNFRSILPGDAVRSFSGSNPIFGGGFNTVLICSPRKLGKMKPFLSHILGQILG